MNFCNNFESFPGGQVPRGVQELEGDDRGVGEALRGEKREEAVVVRADRDGQDLLQELQEDPGLLQGQVAEEGRRGGGDGAAAGKAGYDV